VAIVIAKEPEPFRTNFSSGGYARARLIAAALYAGSVVALLVAGGNVWWAIDDRREASAMREGVDRVQQQSDRFRADLRAFGFSADDPRAVSDLTRRVADLNEILEQKTLSWTTLLNDLETAVPRNVSINSIHPDLKSRVIALQGVALTLQDLAKLMIALEQSGHFTDVFLQQQKTTENNRVEFSIQCTYRRAG
jgi:hypothetical protein